MKFSAPFYAVVVFALIIIGCSSKQDAIAKALNFKEIQNTVDQRQYSISFNTAYPQNTFATQQVVNKLLLPVGNSAGRINLNGQSATLQVQNDSTSAELPFFGERRISGGSYGRDVGITWDNELRDYNVEIDDKAILVTYEVRGLDDTYNVQLNIFSNNSVRAVITSAKRTFMQYDGTFKALDPDQSLNETLP